MISRQDFTFTIGYEGNVAVVDGTLKKRYGSLTAEQLAEKQLYKQAICCAVYEQSTGKTAGESLQRVLEIYNRTARSLKSAPSRPRRRTWYGVWLGF